MPMPKTPTLFTTCEVCRGQASAKKPLFSEGYELDGYGAIIWLHMRQKDWVDNPHDVKPELDADGMFLVHMPALRWATA